jgi:DNA repair exonuclease SbcCD ATPase subunit
MLHNIIHISDIHIRSGDSNKSRYTEYITVFNNLYESISQQPSIINKSAVIVITGDIFHDKNRIGPSGIKIAIYLLQKLSQLAHVFVIRGNHDYRQDFPNEPDLISALMSYNIPNVTYLNTTGIHNFHNISFGLVAIQETLLYGSTSGISSDLPDFPKLNNITSDNYKIALFHGTITGTTLQNGIKNTIHGYPIDWFQGYDAILLGDVHLQQINRACIQNIPSNSCNLPYTSLCHTYTYNDNIPWGYSGSLVQQDFGEPIKGHGYILWNLQDKLISLYHIKNNVGMVKLNYNGNLDDIQVEHKQFIKPVTKIAPLNKIINTKWFPDMLHIRVYGNNISSDDLRLITQKIQSYGKTVLSITKKNITKHFDELATITHTNDSSDILDINSSDKLIQYIQSILTTENKTLHSDKWKQWLLHPESIITPLDNVPDTISNKLQSKISCIQKDISKFIQEFDKVTTQQITTGKLTLHKLEWSWILNYKNNNIFDFDNNIHSISVLNAKNGNGKSNFLEIICIALFGQGFPSRHNKNYSANIICDKKPDGSLASSLITFTLNNNKYMIERTMRNNSLKRSIKFEDVILYNITDGGNKEIIHQKTVAVDKWVELNIGKCETYLMSAMLSQNSDSDFFSLENLEQKRLLDRILSLDHINALQKLLKDVSSYYKTCADLIESYYDGVKSKTHTVDQKYIDELALCQTDLDSITLRKHELYPKWNMVSDKALSSITDMSLLNNRISHLQHLIQSCPTHNSNDVSQQIYELTNMIRTNTDAIYKYHSFSDLSENTHCDLDLDFDWVSSLALENDIASYDLALKLHPYFKNCLKYSIYEPIASIRTKLSQELREFENNDTVENLISVIHNFENWNKIQIQTFANDHIYFENDSEIDKLQLQINSLISIIQDNPVRISELAKKLDKLRKQHKKLIKEKDLCSDRRPNKPIKTKEWLQLTRSRIIHFADKQSLLSNKLFIQSAIQNIPILATQIQALIQKIDEYQTYIKDCSEFPFNPHCDACRLQPWRTKYDELVAELPSLQSQLQQLELQFASFKYDGLDAPLLLSYSSYLKDLDKELNVVCQNISEIELYDNEKECWTQWDKWNAEYDEYKKHYDELVAEMNDIETQKRKLEISLENARLDKQRLQTILENIQSKKLQYQQYSTELIIRTAEYQLTTKKLDWLWYSTLYKYRTCINTFLAVKGDEKMDFEQQKKELESVLSRILEREKYSTELDDDLKLLSAYPQWLEWTQLDASEKALTLKIAELQLIIRGGVGTDNNQMLKCIELLNTVKDDYEDISYIAAAFDGYREWLYSDNIGPIIQGRVNAVLELICDERPLFLECEWLGAIDTLSWFIRDGTSRVVIQKASGFQRFIVGIAMRVAINQIGLSRVRFTELFIDEGFTACDSDNLERVPSFLRGLLRFYGSIYLATHLEDLKAGADKHIYIKRCDDGLSQIQYGCDNVIREIEDSVKHKKRGRPTKNSIIVSKV